MAKSVSGAYIRCLGLLMCSVMATPAAERWEEPFHQLLDVISVRRSGDEVYGRNTPHPLLWTNSRHFIREPTSKQLATALEAFEGLTESEMGAIPSVHRAILQRHLWAVFDWTTRLEPTDWNEESAPPIPNTRNRLQAKLASLLQRVALTGDEIERLPHTFQATEDANSYSDAFDPDDPFRPFFPYGLFDPEGPWVSLRKSYHRLTAEAHSKDVEYRSVFHVFIRLPGDRQETLRYLKELGDFQNQWITDKPAPAIEARTTPNGGINYVDIYVNPDTPQVPVGTRVALVDQALLIDKTGQLIASPLINNVQVRAYLQVEFDHDRSKPLQAFAEFDLRPWDLMKGSAALKAIEPLERKFSTILSNGDPFERRLSGQPLRQPAPRLKSCIDCHSGWGVHSINSRAQLFELRSLLPPRFKEGKPSDLATATIREKRRTYSWGLLTGLWRTHNP